jgi:pSer/pThr/pTyr-binding forkhead associated (FHA) protein
MKVQLIVVQGKPEGKTIPLQGPTFKIGRGENCNLRPNSEQVSREHSEFSITAEGVTIRDLGSRNGTLVNGKALTAPCALKDRDLIQVGPLTFAISIQGVPTPVAQMPAKAPKQAASPDDISHADIESWLIADDKNPTPERPSGVYGGDTQTFTAYTTMGNSAPQSDSPAESKGQQGPPPADESEPENEVETVSDDEVTEEFVDESNPFHKPKKPQAPVKPTSKDSSDAASDILRKMMERRRSSH